MQLKILFRWSLLVTSVVGVSLFAVATVEDTSSVLESVQHTVSVSLLRLISRTPVRLEIPEINIDAPIESVGQTSSGAMAVPVGPVDVAWYELGPRPGENGSAVIAGHEGWKYGIPAVFDNLNKLKPGDEIYVVDNVGSTTSFVVSGTQMFGENSSASEVFVSNDGLAHLNLITCEGIWNASKQSYSGRLVVFTNEE